MFYSSLLFGFLFNSCSFAYLVQLGIPWYDITSHLQHSLNINVQIVNEYSDLLTSQLENQKIVSSYFHSHNLVSQDAISCFNMTSNLIPPTQWASGIHGIGFSDNCQICYDFFLWAYIVKVFGDLLFCSF